MGCSQQLVNLVTEFANILQLNKFDTLQGSWKKGLERNRLSVHDWNVPVHTQGTPEIGVKWTPQENTCHHYFFLNAKLPYSYFKMRIWNRAKG